MAKPPHFSSKPYCTPHKPGHSGTFPHNANPVNETKKLLAGRKHFQARRYPQARKLAHTVLQKNPANTGALKLAADCAYAEMRLPEAIDFYKRGLQAQPGDPDCLLGLAKSFNQVGQYRDSGGIFEKLLQQNPKNAEAAFGLGAAYYGLSHPDKAKATIEYALGIDPKMAKAHLLLGRIAKVTHQSMDVAIGHFQEATNCDPNNIQAQYELGTAHLHNGEPTLACKVYKGILANTGSESDYVYSKYLLSLHYDGQTPRETLFQEHIGWSKRYDIPDKLASNSFPNPRDPSRKLRVGFVSSCLYTHSVYYFLNALFRTYDKERFAFICFSDLPESMEDEASQAMAQVTDGWHRVKNLHPFDLHKLILAQQIDILIDLGGHTNDKLLYPFQKRSAPIQVTWLGYPDSTGLDQMDYRIIDEVTDPRPWADSLASETLYRLPAPFLAYQPPESWKAFPVHPQPPSGGIVFGSFNDVAKLNPEVLQTWCKILQQVPGSKLLIKCQTFARDKTLARFHQAMEVVGLETSRLEVLPFAKSKADHMDLYNRIHIALDPFPYNGTTTTCDALWMGVPILTLEGDRHCARVGKTLLQSIGLGDWVAISQEDYLQKAVHFAQSPQSLAQIKSSLRQQLLDSPLCDSPAFAQKFQTALRNMWETLCQQPVA